MLFLRIGAGFQGRADIATLLLKHGVGLRDLHADGHEPACELNFLFFSLYFSFLLVHVCRGNLSRD